MISLSMAERRRVTHHPGKFRSTSVEWYLRLLPKLGMLLLLLPLPTLGRLLLTLLREMPLLRENRLRCLDPIS